MHEDPAVDQAEDVVWLGQQLLHEFSDGRGRRKAGLVQRDSRRNGFATWIGPTPPVRRRDFGNTGWMPLAQQVFDFSHQFVR